MCARRGVRIRFVLVFAAVAFCGVLVYGGAQQSAATPAVVPAQERPIDYNWDVRPILSDYCFRCHGPDEKARQANLRLDTPKDAYAALRRPGTFAIVPGNPDSSQVIFRVAHENPAIRMPPRVTNKSLSPGQIETLRRWIAQGVQYKPHWAFVAPEKPVPPQVAGRAVNAIDGFIVNRLEREGLPLSREADKEVLINRVTLTLTGLPPTLAEVDAFVADTAPDAYERLVDRLLASPAYAEHMAAYWLDLPRFSESDGFLDAHHHRYLSPCL